MEIKTRIKQENGDVVFEGKEIILKTQPRESDEVFVTTHPCNYSEEKTHREYIATITRNDPVCFAFVSLTMLGTTETWVWGKKVKR